MQHLGSRLKALEFDRFYPLCLYPSVRRLFQISDMCVTRRRYQHVKRLGEPRVQKKILLYISAPTVSWSHLAACSSHFHLSQLVCAQCIADELGSLYMLDLYCIYWFNYSLFRCPLSWPSEATPCMIYTFCEMCFFQYVCFYNGVKLHHLLKAIKTILTPRNAARPSFCKPDNVWRFPF